MLGFHISIYKLENGNESAFSCNAPTTERLAVWQTAVQYHAWHGLALFGVGLLMRTTPAGRGLAIAGWLFIAGIALFSGSLYLLAVTEDKTLGFITPVGGLAFLAGWATLGWTVLRT